MGGMALGTMMAGASAFGSIASGKAQKKAYEAEATQAALQAQQDETTRRRELNDALAMQAVMLAASGRAAGEGSALAIRQQDIKEAGRDIKLIKAGAKQTYTGLQAAGQQAKVGGYVKALSGAGHDMMSMWKAGAFTPTGGE